MFAYTIYIDGTMKQLVCTQRREIVLCKLLLYILFCEKRNKIYGCVVRHRWDTKLVF